MKKPRISTPGEEIDPRELYTPKEAMIYLDIASTTLQRWARGGFIKAEFKPTSSRRYYRGTELLRVRNYTL